MDVENKTELISELAARVASGELESEFVAPAIEELTKESSGKTPLYKISQSLKDIDEPALRRLSGHIDDIRHQKAISLHQDKQSGLTDFSSYEDTLGDLPTAVPLSWNTRKEPLNNFLSALEMIRDWYFITGTNGSYPLTPGAINKKYEIAATGSGGVAEAYSAEEIENWIDNYEIAHGDNASSVVSHLRNRLKSRNEKSAIDGIASTLTLTRVQSDFLEETDRTARQKLLDQLCSWRILMIRKNKNALL